MRALGIEGLTKESEVLFLQELARSMPVGARVVEVGSWKGRSTVAIHDDLPAGALLWAVDTFGGDPDIWKTFGQIDSSEIRAEFEHNTAGCGQLSVIQERSVDASRRFEKGWLDWVFIDADHSYRAVVADIRAWAPKLKPGGLISGHDYGRGGVTDAVRTFFAHPEVKHSIWYSRERPRLQPVALARIAGRRLLRR